MAGGRGFWQRKICPKIQRRSFRYSPLAPSPSPHLLSHLTSHHDRDIPLPETAAEPSPLDRPQSPFFSVAPMMGYTHRHQRKLMSLITKSAVLYTEMVVASTLIHTKNLHQHLGTDFEDENPLVLQLGGSDPQQLAEAAEIARRYGYQRINLNVGCPSERVAGSGCFGASLMMNPELVAEICRAIADKTAIVPSIKCRIGVNDADSYPDLAKFVDTVSRKGEAHQFIIHARKAVLDPSWSPQKNRTIPPLRYEFVYQLLEDFPHLYIGINGGIRSYEEITGHLLKGVKEVMVGRAVIDDPFYFHQIDHLVHSSPTSTLSRGEVLESYAKYVKQIEQNSQKVGEPGVSRSYLLAPILNIFTGCHNGKLFRRLLSEAEKDGSSVADAILRASQVIPDDVLRAQGGRETGRVS